MLPCIQIKGTTQLWLQSSQNFALLSHFSQISHSNCFLGINQRSTLILCRIIDYFVWRYEKILCPHVQYQLSFSHVAWYIFMDYRQPRLSWHQLNGKKTSHDFMGKLPIKHTTGSDLKIDSSCKKVVQTLDLVIFAMCYLYLFT